MTTQTVHQYFTKVAEKLAQPAILQKEGRLTRVVGMTLEAVGCSAPVGSRCELVTVHGARFEAEIVGFSENTTYLMPIGRTYGLAPGTKIIPCRRVAGVPVGHELLGRVIDGAGLPLDAKGPLKSTVHYPLHSEPLNPLSRQPISAALDVGVQAINALLTIGRGQRMGLFAGSGVGKSVLLSMMTRFTTADVVVVGLIGERGREVKEFIEQNLGEEGLARSVIVAAPADQSPLMRLQGALLATTVAEYFRDQGLNVLLLMDSLTRFAQAQREIALAIGEPPATKGYPPSVFTKLPQLVERAGNSANGHGSITAFYTVLSEGDDHNDPISDAARAILDGHIVLTRRLAEEGHYPAIDIEASISRVQPNIVRSDHLATVLQFKRLYAKYQRNSDLINIGAYQAGSDPELDMAIKLLPFMKQFLRQSIDQSMTLPQSVNNLNELFNMQKAIKI